MITNKLTNKVQKEYLKKLLKKDNLKKQLLISHLTKNFQVNISNNNIHAYLFNYYLVSISVPTFVSLAKDKSEIVSDE